MGQIARYDMAEVQPLSPLDLAVPTVVRLPGLSDLPAGQVLGVITGTAQSEVHRYTLGGTPDGGSFRVQFGGEVSGPIAWSGTPATLAANIQAALEGMAAIPAGAVVVTGTGPFDATFQGGLANRAIPAPLLISSLTGTNPTVAVARQTAGHSGPGLHGAYDDAASDGRQVARAILKRRVRTDLSGRVLTERPAPGETYTGSAYIAGHFLCSSLVGLDANAVADLGRLANAAVYTAAGAVLIV